MTHFSAFLEEYLTDVGIRFTIDILPDALRELTSLSPEHEESLLLIGKLPVSVASDIMKPHETNRSEN